LTGLGEKGGEKEERKKGRGQKEGENQRETWVDRRNVKHTCTSAKGGKGKKKRQ